MKRTKGKFPDVDRALANWAKNHVKQGLPLTDAIIQEQARVFASTINHSDGQLKALSSSWLEKFKQKYGIEAKSRKNSMTTVDAEDSPILEANGRQEDISPLSPIGRTTPRLPVLAAKEDDYRASEMHDFGLGPGQQGFRTERNSSMSSAVFSDVAGSYVADAVSLNEDASLIFLFLNKNPYAMTTFLSYARAMSGVLTELRLIIHRTL